MSSESPGNIGKRNMLNLKKPNQMRKEISQNPGDKNTNKCLPTLPSSPLQQRHYPSKTSKRNSNPSNAIRPPHRHLHHPPLLLLLLLLLLNLVPYAAADGFCSPLLCSCQVFFFLAIAQSLSFFHTDMLMLQVETANCSNRGFPTMPGGLGKALKILNLAQNDLQSGMGGSHSNGDNYDG